MTLFVSATNTNIGKTHTMLFLIKKLSELGYKVGVYKPIETGIDIDKDISNSDAYILLQEIKKHNVSYKDFSIFDILSYHFKLPSAPYVAKKDTKIKKDILMNHFNRLSSQCDILLVEGAGGLMVPIDKDFFMIDLIDMFRAKALLVSSSGLGCINDLLLSMNILQSKKIDFKWVVNLYKEKQTFYDVTYPYYKDVFSKVNILEQDDSSIVKFIIHNINDL